MGAKLRRLRNRKGKKNIASDSMTTEDFDDEHALLLALQDPTMTPATQTVESVSMREVGTEMTPIPSQDPSRTGTPMGATTPSRSPRSSMPPTPKQGAIAKVHENDCNEKGGKQELSETELKLKTRGEIAALSIQLGKMNIASWASKEAESAAPSPRNFYAEQNVEAEYEALAAAWEEAEKAKHMARYKRDEVKIQAWESHQKAKIEAKMRKLEVLVERKKVHGHEKISQRVAEARRQVEERRADAEARKNHEAARTAHRVERICRTGRIVGFCKGCMSNENMRATLIELSHQTSVWWRSAVYSLFNHPFRKWSE